MPCGSPARRRSRGRATVRTVVSFGSRSYLGSLSYQGFLRVDVLFLSARYGPSLVGIYSLASTVAEKIGGAGFAMYGATAEAVSQGGPEAARLTSLTTRLMLAMLITAGGRARSPRTRSASRSSSARTSATPRCPS